MNFTKVQGAGNDFVLVETSDLNRDWPQVAKTVCDRHYGIGADGLLLLLSSVVADFKMRIFNPDGFEAEACGNGLRCFARYVIDRGLVKPSARQIAIETIAGVRKVVVNASTGGGVGLNIGMGKPGFSAKDIPVKIEWCEGKSVDITSLINCSITVAGTKLALNPVSMGNPHAVYFYDRPVADFPLLQIGPKVEHHQVFPNGVNFEVARLINRQRIEARVWERGAGETLACGSGACAIAVAARLRGYIDNMVNIKLPGGILSVEWDGAGEVFLSGPAEIVFTGEWLEKNF
jgi:diaminopimelate epimerase